MPILKSKQFSSVIEWADPAEGALFHRFDNVELKKGSVCIVRPGQDVLIIANGEVAGVFTKDGRYNVESDIIPFLSTIAGIKFGFDTGRRVEALFVNTKDILQNWGTRSPINIEFPGLPGGIPVRANGNFVCHVDPEQYPLLVEQIAGDVSEFTVEDLRERLLGTIEQSLMVHISQRSGTIRNLQAEAAGISGEILPEVDAETSKYGIRIRDFKVMSLSYPESVQEKLEQAAGIGLLGNNIAAYQQVAMADGLREGGGAAGMAGMFVGAQAGASMAQGFVAPQNNPAGAGMAAGAQAGAGGGGFCVKCGTALPVGAAFCPNCGNKVG